MKPSGSGSDLDSFLTDVDRSLTALQALRERVPRCALSADLSFEIELRIDLQLYLLGTVRNLLSTTKLPISSLIRRRRPFDPIQ